MHSLLPLRIVINGASIGGSNGLLAACDIAIASDRAVSKKLLTSIQSMSTAEIKEYTARCIAELRSGDEAQEGMAAFFEKRKPKWAD